MRYGYGWISTSFKASSPVNYWLDLQKSEYLLCLTYCILNCSRYFSSHSGIPLTIFTAISPHMSSSDLDLVVSGGRGLSFRVDILSAILSILSSIWFIALFFLELTFFQVLGEIFFLLQDFAQFPFEVVLSLLLFLEVLNYFLETTDVEKRAIEI